MFLQKCKIIFGTKQMNELPPFCVSNFTHLTPSLNIAPHIESL